MRRAHGGVAPNGLARGAQQAHLSRVTTDRKGQTMSHIIEALKTRLRDHAAYVRTRDEIARMPLDVALDLDLHPGDADEIARRAVYGH